MAPIRLVFLLDEFAGPNSGTEAQFLLLLSGLGGGIDWQIFLLRDSPRLYESVPRERITVLNIARIFSWGGLMRHVRTALMLRRRKVQVAHIFLNDASLLFPIALRLAGIKTIVSRRDLGFWYSPLVLKLLRVTRFFASRYAVNCAAVGREVIRMEKVSPEKLFVSFNAAVNRSAIERDRLTERKILGIAESDFVVTLLANLRPLKRVGDAIRAVSALRNTIPGIRLLIAGEDRSGAAGSHRQELESLTHELGVADSVTFLGLVTEPEKCVSAADVCVLCSETEGLSNSIIEYLWSGRPVVASDVGGTREVVQQGKTGFVYPAGDVPALTGYLQRLYADPQLRADMGRSAKAYARRIFVSKRMIDDYEGLYRELAIAVVPQ